jgi:hypothetical protein
MVCQQAEKQRCVETISEWPEESRKGDHPVKSILKQPSSNDDSTSHIKCSISFSEDIDTVEIPALDDDMLDDMFYLEAEIANFKYEAFMEEAGLNASDFEGSSTNSGTSATDLDGSLSFNNTDCSSNSFQERENLASSGSKSQPRGPERSSTKASTLQSEKTIGLLSGFKSKRTMSASEGLDEMDISNRSGRQISASGRLDASNISLHDDPGETKNSVRTKVEMPLLSVGDPRTQATEAKSSRGTTKSIRIRCKIDVIPKPKPDGDESRQTPAPPQKPSVRSSWASHGPSKTATRSPTLLKYTPKTTSPQSYSFPERDSPMPKNIYVRSKSIELSPLAPPSPLSSPRPSPSPRIASIAVQASPSLPLCPPLPSPRSSPSATTESRKLQASSVPLSSPLSSLFVGGETKMSPMTKKRYSKRVVDVLKLSPESSEEKGKVEMPLLSVGDPRTQATEAKSSRGTTKSIRISRKIDVIPKPKQDGDGDECGQAPTPPQTSRVRSSWASHGPSKTATRSPTLLKCTLKTTSPQSYSISERDSPMPKNVYIQSKFVELSPLAPPSPLSSPRPSPSPRMASIAVQASPSLPLCPPLSSPRLSPSPTTESRKLQASSVPLSSPLSSLCVRGETKMSLMTKKRYSTRVEDVLKLSPESSEVKGKVEMPLSSPGDPRTEASETKSSKGTTKSKRIRRKSDFIPKPKPDGNESGQAPTPLKKPSLRSSWVSQGPPKTAARSPTLLKYTPKTTSFQTYSIPERDSPMPKSIYIRSKSVEISPLAPPSPLSSPRPSPSPRMASIAVQASASLPLCPPLPSPRPSPSPTTKSMPLSSPLSSLFGGGETKKSAKTNKITKKRHSKRVEDIRKLSPESSEVKERVEMPLSSTGDPRTEASETRSSNGTTKSIRIRRKRDFFPKPKEDGDESGQAPTPPQTPPVRSSWVSHGPPEAAARSPTLLKYTPKTTSPQSYSIPERDSPTPKTRSKSVKITPLAPPSPLSSPRPSPSPRMASTTIRASPSLPLCPPLSPPKLSPSPTTGSRKHQTSSMPMSSPLSSPRPSPSPRTAARAPYGSFEYGLCSTSSPPQLSYASIASDTVTSGPLSMAVLKYIDSPRGRAYRSHRDKARAIHSQRRLMAEHRNAIM